MAGFTSSSFGVQGQAQQGEEPSHWPCPLAAKG